MEYDEDKSNKLNFLEQNLVAPTYNDNKKLQPFLDILEYAALYVLQENEPGKDTEMIYSGRKELVKGNGESVFFVNKNGYMPEETFDDSGIVNNYTISFHKKNSTKLTGFTSTHINLVEENID